MTANSREEAAREALHRELPWTQFVDDREMVAAVLASNPPVPTPSTYTSEDDLSCSVFRSAVDDRVWMCNIPIVDVATGLQAARSLRKIKAYVEDIAERMLDFGDSEWVRGDDDGEIYWTYREAD